MEREDAQRKREEFHIETHRPSQDGISVEKEEVGQTPGSNASEQTRDV